MKRPCPRRSNVPTGLGNRGNLVRPSTEVLGFYQPSLRDLDTEIAQQFYGSITRPWPTETREFSSAQALSGATTTPKSSIFRRRFAQRRPTPATKGKPSCCKMDRLVNARLVIDMGPSLGIHALRVPRKAADTELKPGEVQVAESDKLGVEGHGRISRRPSRRRLTRSA